MGLNLCVVGASRNKWNVNESLDMLRFISGEKILTTGFCDNPFVKGAERRKNDKSNFGVRLGANMEETTSDECW